MASSPPADAPMPTMGNEPAWSRRRAAAGMRPRAVDVRPGSWSFLPAACFLELPTCFYLQQLTGQPLPFMTGVALSQADDPRLSRQFAVSLGKPLRRAVVAGDAMLSQLVVQGHPRDTELARSLAAIARAATQGIDD